MPPLYRNESSPGSPSTISAPSWERITSSTACRSGVPGATVSIAASRCGSRRGSSSEGVRVKPSSVLSRSGFVCSLGSFGIGTATVETGLDRLAERLRLHDLQCATRGGAARSHDGGETELAALLEPPVGLRRLPEPPGEADLAEHRGPGANRQPSSRRGDRERDGEVRAGLVNAHAA